MEEAYPRIHMNSMQTITIILVENRNNFLNKRIRPDKKKVYPDVQASYLDGF